MKKINGAMFLYALQFKQLVQRKARPSHVLGEIEHRKQLELLEENRSKTGGSVLGQVSLEVHASLESLSSGLPTCLPLVLKPYSLRAQGGNGKKSPVGAQNVAAGITVPQCHWIAFILNLRDYLHIFLHTDVSCNLNVSFWVFWEEWSFCCQFCTILTAFLL